MNSLTHELESRRVLPVPELHSHDVTLRNYRVTLRPMAESDWERLLPWNNDPDVMEFADACDFAESTLEEIQAIYRWISTHAYCFIMGADGRPIGECWLQRMNLQRIVDQFPDEDLRRIGIMIGEKELWSCGYGTEAIGLLVDFGLLREAAHAIFGLVSADNFRSLRAFQKNGFELHKVVKEKDGTLSHDLIARRTQAATLGSSF